MSDLVLALSAFFLSGLAAVFAQNVLMGRGMGLENTTGMEEERGGNLFCLLQAACSLISGIFFWLVCNYLLPHLEFLTAFGMSPYYARAYLWPVGIAVSVSAAYFIVFVCVVKLAPFDSVMPAVARLPWACFNTMVAGILMLSASKNYTFIEMMGFSLGSAAGYWIADLYSRAGARKLRKREMPPAFKGLPASLLYLSGLALAAYAIIGHRLSGLI